MFHILVVEDDAKLRSLFCTVLTNNGYLALPAESGEKALSLLDSEYVDLIISDIMMSGMDGYELIDHLRTSGFTMPILIITAKERFEDKQRGFQAGTDDYMVKPIDVNEMVLRVGALLKRAKLATEHRIVCQNTILDYDALTVTVNGQETGIFREFNRRRKNFTFYINYFLIQIRFSRGSSSWTKSGGLTRQPTNGRSMCMSTGCANGLKTAMILSS